MLENQCNRDVTLLDVMELCREQSSTLKAQHGEVFLSLGGGEGQRRAGRPPGGHDSGFGDHAHSGSSTTSGSNNKVSIKLKSVRLILIDIIFSVHKSTCQNLVKKLSTSLLIRIRIYPI